MKDSSKVVVSSLILVALMGYFHLLISVIDYSQFIYMLMYIDFKY